MNKAFIKDENTLRRIPLAFVFLLIFIMGLPIIALNYFTVDFNAVMNEMPTHITLDISILEARVHRYLWQMLLQWTAISLSIITVLLALTQYRLTRDSIALIIGMAVLFSGLFELLQTVMMKELYPVLINKNLNALIWTVANSISGLVLMIGLILILTHKGKNPIRIFMIPLAALLLLVIAFSLIYYAATKMPVVHLWQEYTLLSRYYDVTYLIIYLVIALFIYPFLYKKYPSILTNCVFYMAVTQIVAAIYLIALSTTYYNGAYNIAYFLKIIVYFIPFTCLIINYIFSYNSYLKTQGLLKINQGKLDYITTHDPLTNLHNRHGFEILLKKTITNNTKENSLFALFIIDIDNFKLINDTLGHVEGDHLLKQFSENLSLLTRKEDILSRIGSDEFALIVTKIASISSAKKIATRMLNQLNIPYRFGNQLLMATASIGIAIYPMDGKNTEDLLKHADIAMQHAKKSGKQSYSFYTKKIHFLHRREAELESYLREALKNDELTVHYQPKFNLLTRNIVGAEVLLRWHNKTLGIISPDEFIPVAENSGLIIDIGQWLLNKVCEQTKQWSEKYKKQLSFSINVSPIQFEHRAFFNNLSDVLKKYDYPAKYLELEVTESLLIKNNDTVTEGLKFIDKLGINIAIDDFGKGYSSLSRLKSLPIHTIKIDKYFISEIQNERDKVIIIDTIIKLAHELDMNVIAEGIETQAQLNYLIAKKCYLGQGFFFSKPLPAEKFEVLAYSF